MLERIQSTHSGGGEVWFRLGEQGEAVGRMGWAASLASQGIDVGYDQPHACLKRVLCDDFAAAGSSLGVPGIDSALSMPRRP